VRPCVFIHTNERQYLGALVSRHSLRRNSPHRDAFDVRILNHAEQPFFAGYEGRPYLRSGRHPRWHNDDLQSFTPLRFLPPHEMGYTGRALVIDPDIFAVGDVWELLSRNLQGKTILARRTESPNVPAGSYASSVMLLDCAKLEHWRCAEQFAELFEDRLDYTDWVCLQKEPAGSIGDLEPEWNDFDHLTSETRLLHNTRRKTQPWKTGLPIDFAPKVKEKTPPTVRWGVQALRRVFGATAFAGRYRRHDDPRQEEFFFGLLRECLDEGAVTEDFLREEMRRNHLRHDALALLERSRAAA